LNFLIVALLILVLLALCWLLIYFKRLQGASPAGGQTGTTSLGGGTTIPDTLSPTALAGLLQSRLAGTPADGSAPTGQAAPPSVIWVDQGDEVVVHLESVATQITGQCVLVSMDLETDQTGRTPLVVAFSLGQDTTGGLIAATDEFPRGNGVLAARWGVQVQQAAWNALLLLAVDHANEQGASPIGLTIKNGMLNLHAGPALQLS